MSASVKDLIKDGRIALDTIRNGKSPVFRKASAEWLEQIAKQIREELAKEEKEGAK